ISSQLEKQVLDDIESKLYQNIPTFKIYQQINQTLKTSSEPHVFARYQLKQAIMQFGPTGFPFENFVAAILAELGYSVKVGVIVPGICVNHEVDVVAVKDNQHFMVECKFHNRPGTRSDVKVALYVKARFDDVKSAWVKKPGHQNMFHQAWLVTNTKLTSDAIKFGECTGMNLIAWSYPKTNCLQDLITRTKLHPVTCLNSISQYQKKQLLDQGIVLCRSLHQQNSDFFRSLNISEDKAKAVKQEVEFVCNLRKEVRKQ
ncbi:restriction endonuclease, partial [Microgenomates group bacterium]|nr:restriction endonuclease [Microgenomates group bacterium]